MEDVKNLLTVTLVVMAAGSSIYTIKTYMKPGMDLNINLEENGELALDGAQGNLSDSFQLLSYDNLTALITEFPFLGLESGANLTLPLEAHAQTVFNKSNATTISSAKRSLPVNETKILAPKLVAPKILDAKPLVTTALGKIEGTHLNVLGKSLFAYLGVPYAQAPVDGLRFKAPLPLAPWGSKAVSAKAFGKACIQVAPKNQTLEMSENCLNLNIWSPCNGVSSPMPVLFFIHGGSFNTGSNSADETDGRVLAALQNLVVVSVNYRLGPFGFLTLPGSEESGNLGLYDLVEALKWTRANIKYFGGNPEAITVVGHSSGALATALLLTSPETKSLFKRAILQSGASTVFNFYYQQSAKSSEEYATLLGCPRAGDRLNTLNQDSVRACVHNSTSEELVRAAEKQLSREAYSYSPRIGDSLVPTSPKTMLEELKIEAGKREVLMGTNANEAAFFVNMGYPLLFTKKTPSLKDLEEVRQFLSASLKDWGISRRTLRLINSFFLEKSTILDPKLVLRSMYDIFGDLTFTCPTHYFAEKFAAKANQSTYFYFYNHSQTPGGGGAGGSGGGPAPNASDELPYVFGFPLRFPHKYSGLDIDFSKKMMAIWGAFVRTGKPPAINGLTWPRYTPESQSYVELNGKEARVMHQTGASGSLGASNGTSTASSGAKARFNCDTFKHSFKIFT